MSNVPELVNKGLESFNQSEFYRAHEFFETAWRQTTDDSREFFRALLHLSGGFYRLTQNRPEAARKFFTHALRWFDTFPAQYHGFDVGTMKANLHQLISAIDRNLPSDQIRNNHYHPITRV